MDRRHAHHTAAPRQANPLGACPSLSCTRNALPPTSCSSILHCTDICTMLRFTRLTAHPECAQLQQHQGGWLFSPSVLAAVFGRSAHSATILHGLLWGRSSLRAICYCRYQPCTSATSGHSWAGEVRQKHSPELRLARGGAAAHS